MVVFDAVKVKVKGTVSVSVWLAVAPPDDLAVSVKVVVAVTGTMADPELGNALVSSDCATEGEIVIDAALVVAQVMVVVWPAFNVVGFALNVVIVGAGPDVLVVFPLELHPTSCKKVSSTMQKPTL